MVWSAWLGAVLVVAGVAAESDSTLGRIVSYDAADGPAVLVRLSPGSPLVALRLSIPIPSEGGMESSAGVLQALAADGFHNGAAELGASASITRTETHAIYRIVGPRSSFDQMAALLRRAVSWPGVESRHIDAAAARALHGQLASLETPALRIRHQLRRELFSSPTSATVLDGVRQPPDPAGLEWFWRRYYVPQRMAVVVVGDVSPEVAVSAFRGWPTPPPAGPPPSTAGEIRRVAPEVIFPWAGLGYEGEGMDPAVLMIVAVLVERQLRVAGVRGGTAEYWWNGGAGGLVVIGSVDGNSGQATPSSRLRRAVVDAAATAGPSTVAEARRALRHSLLFSARTPQGLAELIGDFYDRTGDPDAANAFLRRLRAVDPPAVQRALRTLADSSPRLVELSP